MAIAQEGNAPLPSVLASGAEVQVLVENGGHVDWCWETDTVAFDRRGADGYFDVWLMNPDGSHQRPLTARTPDLPRRHVGMPAWHPSGHYLAIQAQQPHAPRRFDNKSVPGAGIFNDLWIISADGKQAWKLVEVSGTVSRDAEGILHPHFSHDGRLLLWSQRIGATSEPGRRRLRRSAGRTRSGKTRFGNWVLKLAEFIVTPRGRPILRNIRTLVPGGKQAFFESHGFSPDDRQIIFSGTQDVGLEIYTMDLSSQRVQRLTHSPSAWDEHAHFSPDGRTIVWMSSKGLRFQVQPFDLQTEFWLMNSDGSDQQRLTHFHKQSHPHHMDSGFAVPADVAWGPDGKCLIGLVITARPETPERGSGAIVRITLGGRPQQH